MTHINKCYINRNNNNVLFVQASDIAKGKRRIFTSEHNTIGSKRIFVNYRTHFVLSLTLLIKLIYANIYHKS